MIHCLILVLVQLVFTLSYVEQTKICKQMSRGHTGHSSIGQKICEGKSLLSDNNNGATSANCDCFRSGNYYDLMGQPN